VGSAVRQCFACCEVLQYSHTETDLQAKKKVDFILRLGHVGFRDSWSSMGKLGGGQLALDIKPSAFPIALSLSGEYYPNSSNPTHVVINTYIGQFAFVHSSVGQRYQPLTTLQYIARNFSIGEAVILVI
jgi:hypothetical protein